MYCLLFNLQLPVNGLHSYNPDLKSFDLNLIYDISEPDFCVPIICTQIHISCSCNSIISTHKQMFCTYLLCISS